MFSVRGVLVLVISVFVFWCLCFGVFVFCCFYVCLWYLGAGVCYPRSCLPLERFVWVILFFVGEVFRWSNFGADAS